MRLSFIDGNDVREIHNVDLDLRADHFLASLDEAIRDLQQDGHLYWFYRRGGVTLPHERSDDQAEDEEDIGELRQDMQIAIWGRPKPPHVIARERRGRVRRYLGKNRWKPY